MLLAAQYRHPGLHAETMISTTEGSDARAWLTEHRNPHQVGQYIWAEIGANDWADLIGEPPMPAIQIASMEQELFDQQNSLMKELNVIFSAHIQHHPGRPLRIASLLLVSEGDDILSEFTVKPVEDAVAAFIEPAVYPDDVDAGVFDRIQANVYATLLASGQGQWIAANWESIRHTHDIFIDVDYYPDRMPDLGGGLHKDSVGETLFVNLTYNNEEEGTSPEYVVDNNYQAEFEGRMPVAANALIASARRGNRNDDGSIHGVNLPPRGRVSFIDPAVWHATPLYDHRPQLNCADDATGNREQVREFIQASTFRDDIKYNAIDRLPDGDFTWTGAQLKEHMRGSEQLRFGFHTNSPDVPLPLIDTAPHARRPRARSVDLTNNPEHLELLQAQSQVPRSFIRTWIIIRPKPDTPSID
jgi:hypothetical protein